VERTRRIRIGRLTTVGQVAAELGRFYRHARQGEIPVADASRLATILAVMRQCLEASELDILLNGPMIPARERSGKGLALTSGLAAIPSFEPNL
jgi:hypothetical protein